MGIKKHVAVMPIGNDRQAKPPMKKYLILLVAVVVLGAGSYFTELQFLSYSNPSALPSKSPAASTSTSAHAETQTASTASLVVGEQSYIVAVSPDKTVMDAMRRLESSGDITLTGKEYPSMGFFVESINGKRNSADRYWILYINGKLSDSGASQTIVHPGDSIEWRYEKGY
jgi:hypothetical protein